MSVFGRPGRKRADELRTKDQIVEIIHGTDQCSDFLIFTHLPPPKPPGRLIGRQRRRTSVPGKDELLQTWLNEVFCCTYQRTPLATLHER